MLQTDENVNRAPTGVDRVPARYMSWLIGAFTSVVLLLLVVIPLIFSYRTEIIIARLNQQADPAEKLGVQIQAALSHEVADIVSFQETGKTAYSGLYAEDQTIIRRAVAELEQVAPRLGPTVEARFNQVRSALEAWHAEVEANKLATVRLPKGNRPQALGHRHHILQQAYDAATSFNQAVGGWQAEQRAVLRNLAKQHTSLSIGLACLVLVAMILVLHSLGRLNKATAVLEARAKDEETLRQVAHTLTSAFTLDDVLQRITQTISMAGEAESAFVELINEEENRITCVGGYGPGVPPNGTTGAYAGSLAQEVLTIREPRIIGDVSVERERQSVFGNLASTCADCAAMVVPLISDNRNLGALFLIRKHPKYFSHKECPRIKILSDMASLAIQRALTVETLRKREAEEHFSSEAATILASSLDYDATLKSIARLAVPHIADWCAVHLVDNGTIRTAEVAHIDPNRLSIARAMLEKYPPRPDRATGPSCVIRTGTAELYPDISDELLKHWAQDEQHYALLRRLNLRSAMIVPLSAGGQSFGALTFATEGERRYAADDLSFAERIARHMALAIQNARLYTSTQRAIQTRDEVLRVVSHDLRNPVGNIRMAAGMLRDPTVPEPNRLAMVDMIHRSAQRMSRLIEDLLAVVRLREGQPIPLKLQPENPADIVEEACEAFRVLASAKSINLRWERPAQIAAVNADRDRIVQVLSNLLDNALKFTPAGGRIHAACKLCGNAVRFSVSDTGRGIDQQYLNEIFDLFWQDRTTAHMGSGLGLAIAKAIVQQHGGKIWARSRPGLRTTVFFTLPRAGEYERPPGEPASI
jgi:signal transduction histidine kinase